MTSANIQENRPEVITVQAAGLGVVFGLSVALIPQLTFYPFVVYTAALAVFHFLEYWITARYSSSKVNEDSFLLNHSGSYLAAHAAAMLETWLELHLFPETKLQYGVRGWCFCIGLVIMVLGQTLRSLAMKTAGESFSHVIATEHKHQHVLVTSGVYKISRHPSYAGYFWWAVGSQIMLANPVCVMGFAVVLFKFFNRRIPYEEAYLLAFFKDDYVRYRKQKSVLIPFIK